MSGPLYRSPTRRFIRRIVHRNVVHQAGVAEVYDALTHIARAISDPLTTHRLNTVWVGAICAVCGSARHSLNPLNIDVNIKAEPQKEYKLRPN